LARSLLSKESLKAVFEQIELELGREAKSPARKLKDRTIDIDIIRQGITINSLIETPLEEHYNRQVLSSWIEIDHLTKPSAKES
jgi:2-amino-4-hydroxy-6-hydroxymethyldihydropteridine diphosphokinase